MRIVILVCTVLCFFSATAQDLNVLRYTYHLSLSDAHDSIYGVADMQVLQRNKQPLRFNLKNIGAGGKGMTVSSVAINNTSGGATAFTHEDDLITIPVESSNGDTLLVRIKYKGIPADGLIISKNKFGDRTFFADNWPDRARQWIPCNDRQDDKAAVSFLVTVPAHYKVVANGVLVEEKESSDNMRFTHWQQTDPISTKVMTLGVARFAVKHYADSSLTPVSAWVFPQDSAKGFSDYAVAPGIIRFYTSFIGPYPFKKLANVQSKTIFGGLENASAIFYGENTVTGDGKEEDLIAHEIAHQWFGNAATEAAFPHLWLSEGFATYMTLVYFEKKYGTDTLAKGLMQDRDQIIAFARQSNRPVVDLQSSPMEMLNANSYQKGGWVLHMLRREVGDGLFQKILQTYYAQYKGRTADSKDFQRVATAISGKNLDRFFKQWLYEPGLPKMVVQWKHSAGNIQLAVQQTGDELFHFPLEVAAVDASGRQTVYRLQINKRKENFKLPAAVKPTVILLDPNVNLLFDGTVID